jgi:phytoene synthase
MTAGHVAANQIVESEAEDSARGSSFYTAMRIMPPPQRGAMYEIYHFCRAVDDIADEEGDVTVRLAQLQQWREDITRVYAGDAPTRLLALAKAIQEFGLKKDDFLAVIDGMEMDVCGPIQAPELETLILYCDRVASAVGRLSVRVFAMSEEDGLQLSHHLGLALQLTNILRDIDEDAMINRLYLPRELLQTAGIKTTNPREAIAHPAIGNACNSLAEKALSHFQAADEIMKRCERRQVRTPRVMSQAYRAIHTALVERGFVSPRLPVHLSKARLGFILMRNILF